MEFVAYMGSGYGSGPTAASEGSTIYALDILTGDVVAAVNVGDRAEEGYENALVAGPAGFPRTARARNRAQESRLQPDHAGVLRRHPRPRVAA